MRTEVSQVENNITVFGATWLACAFLAAFAVQSKLPGGKAFRALALAVKQRGTSARGMRAALASLGAPAYDRIHTDRPMGDEQQTDHTANGGVRRPRYAWREPVTT
jgi:hypothetical protein